MNIDFKGGPSSYSKGMLVGALIGGAVSGLAALLFAPKKGSELRQDIAAKTGETYSNIASKAGDLAHDAVSRVSSLVENVQSRNEHKVVGNGHSHLEKSTSSGSKSGNS
jgi:gas vesicle protein